MKPFIVFAALWFIGIFSSTLLVAQPHEHSSGPLATIGQGTLQGIDDSGIRIFKGVPFARPPVDDLRWREPQDAVSWEGVYQATEFSPACMQLPIYSDMIFRGDGVSEDCLYLNIWTPAREAGEKLPVLLYYYGGGFMAGDGSEPRYDGASMARNHGIITVTVNYRLGVFGFFAHPELTEESPNGASGNYGLLDQAKALQWVKNNISAFGGDPSNITIAGESAGSISVSAQMASPLSRGLIAGAIGESGSIMGTLSAVPLQQSEQTGRDFAQTAGASSLDELRALTAEDLLQASGSEAAPRFSPTIDGHFLPAPPEEIYTAGRQADIPLFIGWNSQEMNYRALLRGKHPSPENYESILRQQFGGRAEKALQLYPGSTTEEVVRSATDLAGDQFIGYSTWKWSDLHRRTSGHPVYRYYYTQPRPPQKNAPGDGSETDSPEENKKLPEPNGAVHAAEIEYIMGNLPHNEVYDWTPEDFKVSDIFQKYAANFIKTKNPNGIGIPNWEAVNRGETARVLHIGSTTELKEEQHRQRYLFLDRSR